MTFPDDPKPVLLFPKYSRCPSHNRSLYSGISPSTVPASIHPPIRNERFSIAIECSSIAPDSRYLALQGTVLNSNVWMVEGF
jgi:hypothetical protein